ncbi:MAG: DUF2314 domain-containing protein [Gemmataceae bacterium]
MGLWSWFKGLFRRQPEESPAISLVLLLNAPRYLDAEMLRSAIQRAFDIDIDPDDEETSNFVVGDGDLPTFAVQVKRSLYLVHNFGRPYLEDASEVAATITELRLRKAIEEHQGWIAVDALGYDTRQDPYPDLGKLVAELADGDCLAIFAPATGQINLYDPGMDEILRSGNPLQVFETLGNVPIVMIEDDDPRMQAAVAEARARFPEFVRAFEQRRSDQCFSIKAPFRDGSATEFMWLTVTGIENHIILGELDNDPVNVKNVRSGSRVRIPEDEINDWLICDQQNMVGGFTIEVLKNAGRQKSR